MNAVPPPLPRRAKNRLVYILLAINLGILGAHDFYSGRHGCGWTKLGLLGACLMGMAALYFTNPHDSYWPLASACKVALIALELWSLVDAISQTKDAEGVPLT